MDEFDYIVAGGGTAGCVLAARLSESGEHSVLLVEAGGEASSPLIRIPVGFARLLASPRYNWMYVTAPEPMLGGRVLDQPAGRVLGGTGSINAMLYIRGQPEDYNAWQEAGCEGWGWNEVLPWFRHSERNQRGGSEWHGTDGLLAVSDMPQREALADAFIAAALEAGHPAIDDFNGPRQEGAGYYQMNAEKGRRASTATAYLAPARRRHNLEVLTDSVVTRIAVDNGVATGVDVARAGVSHRFRARREVVLAAGTYGSPRLLELSGIGDAARLQALGIAVVNNLPGVGEGLQNHFRAPLVLRARAVETLNDRARQPLKRVAMALRYLLTRKGQLAASSYAGGFFRAGKDAVRPDMQVTFWNYSVERRDSGGVILHRHPGFTANAVLLRPRSRGSVHVVARDPRAAPEIRANHLCEEYDRDIMAHGLELLRRIVSMPALARYVAEEIAPGPACATHAALVDYARNKGNSVYHPVGTCRMGADEGSVVDTRLRVRGIDGLRIADASVMPAIVSGNTNAPTVMIAERAAAWMLAS